MPAYPTGRLRPINKRSLMKMAAFAPLRHLAWNCRRRKTFALRALEKSKFSFGKHKRLN